MVINVVDVEAAKCAVVFSPQSLFGHFFLSMVIIIFKIVANNAKLSQKLKKKRLATFCFTKSFLTVFNNT